MSNLTIKQKTQSIIIKTKQNWQDICSDYIHKPISIVNHTLARDDIIQ